MTTPEIAQKTESQPARTMPWNPGSWPRKTRLPPRPIGLEPFPRRMDHSKWDKKALNQNIGALPHRQTRPAFAGSALAAFLVLALAGCGRGAADWRQTAPAQPTADQTVGYARPPRLNDARRLEDGGWLLTGTSDAQDRVRLSAPGGDAYGATADNKGQWTITIPAAAQIRLFGLSEVLAGQVIQSEGYIALTPPPAQTSVLLRAGVGAMTVARGTGALKIATVDCDAAGGAVISGLARPGANLHLSVDGGAPVEARADADGRFSIALSAQMKTGDHQATVTAGADVVGASFTVGGATPISGPPYRAARQSGRWRIDWITPGGGLQTTYVLD